VRADQLDCTPKRNSASQYPSLKHFDRFQRTQSLRRTQLQLAATLLLDTGADLALLCNNGHSALRLARRRARADKAPKRPEHREHKALVRLLKKRGAV
jgi:hypothetical protein